MDRRIILAAAATLAFGAGAVQAQTVGDLVKAAAAGLPKGISEKDAGSALRAALVLGAAAAVTQVGRADGYWGDNTIRIPLPGALGQLQKTLKPLGLSQSLDDLQLRLNRGAEAAAPKAKSLLTDAIKAMTIEDVAGVLRGGDTAATDYLRGKTYDPLKTAFTPPVATALSGAGAFTMLDKVAAANNLQGVLGEKPRDSLTSFAVGKALDGLFHYVAKEEVSIRKEPVKRTTTLLRRVFGAL
jgi:hypothetical protein